MNKVRVVHSDRSAAARGFTLVELSAVLAIAAISATGAMSGIVALRDATTLLTAQQQLATALEHARLEAYLGTRSIDAEPIDHGNAVRVTGSDTQAKSFDIEGARIIGAPTRGHVRFFASGLAQNATFTLVTPRGSRADVVVNQRGEIRWRDR